jgi:hypothetical protein
MDHGFSAVTAEQSSSSKCCLRQQVIIHTQQLFALSLLVRKRKSKQLKTGIKTKMISALFQKSYHSIMNMPISLDGKNLKENEAEKYTTENVDSVLLEQICEEADGRIEIEEGIVTRYMPENQR